MSNYSKFSQLGQVNQPELTDQEKGALFSIRDEQHKQQIISNNRVVIIDVYGDWCGPCKAIAPAVTRLAIKYNKPGFCTVCKENVDLEMSPEVRGVPTFLCYKKGVLVDTIVGGDVKKVEETLLRLTSTE